jgi:hypothetical protein
MKNEMLSLPDKEHFNFKECEVGGDPCWLITPKELSVPWDHSNARFRSCVLRQSDNFVVSQGFAKFTNFGEKPDFQRWDPSWPVVARHKLDGSCLIVSKYKDQIVVRTRGNIDAYSHPNGDELKDLFNFEYLFDMQTSTSNISYLFEWTSPSNIIVIRESQEPKLTLIGVIENDRARYISHVIVADIAKRHGLDSPQQYTFENIDVASEMVKLWKGKEGIVIYSPCGQILKKIKADEYCRLHKVATGLTNTKQVLNLFLTSKMSYKAEDFYKFIEDSIDYEVAERLKDEIVKITEAYGKYIHTRDIIEREVNSYIRSYETRKEQAQALSRNWKSWCLSLAFNALDNREPNVKLVETAMLSLLNLKP